MSSHLSPQFKYVIFHIFIWIIVINIDIVIVIIFLTKKASQKGNSLKVSFPAFQFLV